VFVLGVLDDATLKVRLMEIGEDAPVQDTAFSNEERALLFWGEHAVQ
jgi:hypothetical protein